MSVMGFNPAMEMSQLRTQQTLAMQSGAAPAAAAAPVSTAGAVAAVPAAAPAAAMTAGAAAPGAAGDAAVAAEAVQPPPATSKIVLQSVLKGAMSGASVTLGLKTMGPILTKVPFIAKLVGNLAGPAGAPAAAGVLGFLGKLPLVGKLLPMIAKGGLAGFAITALIGAGVGAIGGFISGQKKAKQAQADYEAALAAQQAAAPPPAPAEPEPAPAPAPKKAASTGKKRTAKTWVIAKHGSKYGTGQMGHYTAKPGDTIEILAKRFYTTPAEIRKLNPDLGSGEVKPGTTLKLRRQVIPDAQPWSKRKNA